MATAEKKKRSTIPEGFTSANIPFEFWKPANDGDMIRGHYQGVRTMPARDGYPEQDVYDLADENGELLGVSGAALERQFERVPIGAEVIIRYNGRKASKGGKAAMKDFDVLVKGDLLPPKRND